MGQHRNCGKSDVVRGLRRLGSRQVLLVKILSKGFGSTAGLSWYTVVISAESIGRYEAGPIYTPPKRSLPRSTFLWLERSNDEHISTIECHDVSPIFHLGELVCDHGFLFGGQSQFNGY